MNCSFLDSKITPLNKIQTICFTLTKQNNHFKRYNQTQSQSSIKIKIDYHNLFHYHHTYDLHLLPFIIHVNYHYSIRTSFINPFNFRFITVKQLFNNLYLERISCNILKIHVEMLAYKIMNFIS